MSDQEITAERAKMAMQRLVNSHFNNDNRARCRIPVDADDDDIVASSYVMQSDKRIRDLESALAEAETELERKGGPIFKMFVWRGRPDWIVMCHARTVEEARNLAIEDSRGDGDWSTPVRLRMMKTVRETSPEIHYRECGETVLTANGETEELDLYAKTKDAEIDGLKAENERLRAPVSKKEWRKAAFFVEDTLVAIRDDVNALLAARSQQPTTPAEQERPDPKE